MSELTRRGIELWKAKQYEEASHVLRQALTEEPRSFDANLHLGRVELLLGHPDRAEKVLQTATEVKPEDARCWLSLAQALAARQAWDQAVDSARRSHSLDPRNEWGRLRLGEYLLKAGRVEEATAILELLTRDKPEFKWGWSELAACYLKAGRRAEARHATEAHLKLDPQSKTSQGRMAELSHDGPAVINVPVRVHLVSGTERDEASVRGVIASINAVWKAAGIQLGISSIRAVDVPPEIMEKAFPGDSPSCQGLTTLTCYDSAAVNLFCVSRIPLGSGSKQQAWFYGYPRAHVLLYSDRYGGPHDVPALCLGELMGIKRDGTLPPARLFNSSTPGTQLVETEIRAARSWAEKLVSPLAELLATTVAALSDAVGVQPVKDKLLSLRNYAHVEMRRRQKGLTPTPLALHTIFRGPMGTGRRHLAALLGRLYRSTGALSSTRFVEAQGFRFQHSYPTSELERAAGGVLCIHEVIRPSIEKPEDCTRIAHVLRQLIDDVGESTAIVLVGTPEEIDPILAADPIWQR